MHEKVELECKSTFASVIGCNGQIRAVLGGSSQQSEQSILMTFTEWEKNSLLYHTYMPLSRILFCTSPF